MKRDEPKTIRVYDKGTGRLMNNCTLAKAQNLVELNQAEWTSESSIVLFNTRQDVKEQNKKIISDANRICYICNQVIPEGEDPTIDHVIPRAKRSKYVYDLSNRKCCCRRCNTDKKNRTLSEYIYHIEKFRNQYDYISKNQLRKLKKFATEHEKKYLYDEIIKLGRQRKERRDEE